MQNNDEKIDTLRKNIEEKRNALGKKPRVSYITNVIMPIAEGKNINFNILRSKPACFDVARTIALELTANTQAAKLLNVEEPVCMIGEYPAMDWVTDLKLKLSAIVWEEEKVKLDKMDTTLAALLSEQAKTSNLLSDIEDSLK